MSAATPRYRAVSATKAGGATYTPPMLARFVAQRIVDNADLDGRAELTLLDPAIGDGELVLALLEALAGKTRAAIRVSGFDTDAAALAEAARRIDAAGHANVRHDLARESFLDFVSRNGAADSGCASFDLIVANPPYVRTQVMGAERARQLAVAFGLAGRVDLYHAFLLGIARTLAADGTAAIIVSNRFMTTKGAGAMRAALRRRFDLREVWDLGDTRLFDAAVLPAVIVARGTAAPRGEPARFTSIYKTNDAAAAHANDPVAALAHEGPVEIEDGRRFVVRHGALSGSGGDDEIWRLGSQSGDEWLATVARHAWKRFGGIGNIRVGVKTCADRIFIRHDWDSAFGDAKPELLRPLTTHHLAGRFRAVTPEKHREILYPHEVANGRRRAVPLEAHPKSRAYLESYRAVLEGRSYVLQVGRLWYELWVPHDPRAWTLPKLVFRDISERPMFWIDLDGSVVNGDCYWMTAARPDGVDLLWLAAAVANSTFAEAFYDRCFNNKLYAGRRRFITQYVEQFPLPDPELPLSRDIIARAKALHAADHASATQAPEDELDARVWRAFGLRA